MLELSAIHRELVSAGWTAVQLRQLLGVRFSEKLEAPYDNMTICDVEKVAAALGESVAWVMDAVRLFDRDIEDLSEDEIKTLIQRGGLDIGNRADKAAVYIGHRYLSRHGH